MIEKDNKTKNKNIENGAVTQDVKSIAIKSVKWSSMSEIASYSIQPIVVLILARLLTPADFGIVGVAMIAIGLAKIFMDFGLGKTLIQRENQIVKSANIIFWTNITLSLLLYGIFFFSAPLLSKFFHEPRIINVLRVLCLDFVLFSIVSVHQALLQRNFQFRQLFFIRLGFAIISGIVSIPLALLGYGVWALVFGTLAGAMVQILLFWKISPWRPLLNYDFQLAKQLFGFGSWVTLETFLSWLILWGDSIVLGHFLGVKELGVYRVGVTFLIFVFGIFFNPLLPVAYSAFSRLQSKREDLIQSFIKITQIMAFISLPMGVGLVLLAPSISSVVFGQKWQGIEIVIALIGIMHGIAWVVGINPEVYRAIGRPDINSKLSIAVVLYYIPIYILAAPHGLLIFCIARFIIAFISLWLHFFVVNRILKLPFAYLSGCIKSPLIGSLIMAIVIFGEIKLFGTFYGFVGWVKMLGVIVTGGIVYLFTLRLIAKDFTKELWTFAGEAIK